MPAYPTLAIASDSKRIVRDGREEDFVGDGASRIRKMHADKYDFEVHHPSLNTTDASTFTTFYNTYGTSASIDFTWPEDGVTYQVRFGKAAYRSQWKTPTRRDFWVRLVAA